MSNYTQNPHGYRDLDDVLVCGRCPIHLVDLDDDGLEAMIAFALRSLAVRAVGISSLEDREDRLSEAIDETIMQVKSMFEAHITDAAATRRFGTWN